MGDLMELIAKVKSNEAGEDVNGDGNGTGNRGIIVEGYGSEVDVIELPGYRIPRNVQVRFPAAGGARGGRGNVPAAVVGGGGGGSGGNVDVAAGGGGGPAVPPGGNPAGFQVLRYSFDNLLNLQVAHSHVFHDILPNQFQSWDSLGRRLKLVFQEVQQQLTPEQIALFPGGNHNPPIDEVTVENCWPGAVVIFGRLLRFPGEQLPTFVMLNWTHHLFPDVRDLISCVAVLEVFSRVQH